MAAAVAPAAAAFGARSRGPHDLADYWAEYRDFYDTVKDIDIYDEPLNYEEGEHEALWLQAAGLGELAVPWQCGREVADAQLSDALRRLPREQAAAVRRRVHLLNRTARRRRRKPNGSSARPDIRDLFRDQENSSGSEPRSRSATPDSLDSLPSGGSSSPPAEWADPLPNNYADNFPVAKHAALCRTPSAPPSTFSRNSTFTPPTRSPSEVDAFHRIPVHELFKASELHWADVASNTEGIELLGYQRFGTVHGPRLGRERIDLHSFQENQTLGRRKHAITRANSDAKHLSSADKLRIAKSSTEEWMSDKRKHIDEFTESQSRKLTPLLWLELTALFDRYDLPVQKKIAHKKKKKDPSEGSVFGLSLLTLLRKDHLVMGDTDSIVPKVLTCMTTVIKTRSKEEGILRIPGNKAKIETLYNDVEKNFYSEERSGEKAILSAPVHDVSALLKRFLRELPQPIFTAELLHFFYQTHVLEGADLGKALNYLILLLPFEHRATLFELVDTMIKISEKHDSNKMCTNNVAMIMAPTFFPPNHILKASDGLDAQLKIASNSTYVTEAIIKFGKTLWEVQPSLYNQMDRKNCHLHSKKT